MTRDLWVSTPRTSLIFRVGSSESLGAPFHTFDISDTFVAILLTRRKPYMQSLESNDGEFFARPTTRLDINFYNHQCRSCDIPHIKVVLISQLYLAGPDRRHSTYTR